MNRVLNGIESRKNDKHLKTWVKLRIYHRKNETFFVRKSFLWQRESIKTTMLLFWKSQSFLFLWSESEFQVNKSQKYFRFSFICRVCAGSNWVNQLWHLLSHNWNNCKNWQQNKLFCLIYFVLKKPHQLSFELGLLD